jgi:hypothetical protein
MAALAVFAAGALWTMWRLAGRAVEAIPGDHAGDNVAALWNVWWFGYALDHSLAIYRTPMLFAPYGTQLSLHTHATMHSVIAWPFVQVLGVVGGHNAAITCGLVLNGFVTFALTRALLSPVQKTGSTVPGLKAGPGFLAPLVAGLMFAFSAFIQARVLGHINLLHAWVLPLFALALLRWERRPGIASAILTGTAGAVVVYTDYYYAVYAAIFAVLWIANRIVAPALVPRPPVAPALRRLLLVLIVLDAMIIAIIVLTQGAAVDLGPFKLSMRGVRNPLTLLWFLLALWTVCRFPVRLAIRASVPPAPAWMPSALTLATVLLLLTAPLWIALAKVIAQGDYTSPRILWRSSPAGVDVLTLLLGHPAHFLTGSWTTSAYGALGVDRMEQGMWLGIIPLFVLVSTRNVWARVPAARFWFFTGAVFLLLALGPFLRVAGYDSALPLPDALLRYVPVFSNARIPGRAGVLVSLAVAVLTSFGLAHLGRSRRRLAMFLAVLIVLETLPAPAPDYQLPTRDTIDVLLRETREDGAVAELPLGLRDGFGERGQLDHRALVHQIWHERPLAGGFVARVPASVTGRYLATPVLKHLVEASTPLMEDVRLPDTSGRDAGSIGIAYVIVNRDTFIADRLRQADLERAGFVLVQTAGPRELYAAPSDGRRQR